MSAALPSILLPRETNSRANIPVSPPCPTGRSALFAPPGEMCRDIRERLAQDKVWGHGGAVLAGMSRGSEAGVISILQRDAVLQAAVPRDSLCTSRFCLLMGTAALRGQGDGAQLLGLLRSKEGMASRVVIAE